MATEVTRAKLLPIDGVLSTVAVNKSNWTELQQLQFLLGIWDGVIGSPVQHRKLPKPTWVPNDEWRSLQGILPEHSKLDTTEIKRRDHAFEEEHDVRKFGRRR